MVSPQISVVIPVYNRADLLPATLASLIHQTRPTDEIIVVDDGSTDNSVEVARSFHPSIRVVCQANAGPAVARNRGLKESKGEFIHFLDSDDLALANKQKVQIQALESTGADIAFGPWVKGQISDFAFIPENQVYQQTGLPNGDLVERLLSDWSVIPHTCLYRRSIVEASGGFPEGLFVGEDQMMFLRCLLAGAKVVHTPETLTLYRSDNTQDKLSGSASSDARRRMHWAKFLLLARSECLSHGIDPLNWTQFRQRLWQAKQNLNTLPDVEAIDLAKQITALIGNSKDSSYRRRQWMQQKRSGLRQRLVGRREGSAFKMGPMTEQQIKMTHDLFSGLQ